MVTADELRSLLDAGGWVSAPLVATSLTLWFVATLRLITLRRGFGGDVKAAVEQAVRHPLDIHADGAVGRYLRGALGALERSGTCQHHVERFLEIERERVTDLGTLLMGLVTIAPLLGLLGTVSGMIETFSSMQGTTLNHATEQTVAGGISVALISTQLGLMVGVPGLAVARLLARLEAKRARELLQAHSVLVQRRQVPQ
ncbi:MAG: MotA/TolQ/ExbB proton channel family protein [Nannocystales bacterium]